jgi:hypothetical protein
MKATKAMRVSDVAAVDVLVGAASGEAGFNLNAPGHSGDVAEIWTHIWMAY